jgi:hypothetical protein
VSEIPNLFVKMSCRRTDKNFEKLEIIVKIKRGKATMLVLTDVALAVNAEMDVGAWVKQESGGREGACAERESGDVGAKEMPCSDMSKEEMPCEDKEGVTCATEYLYRPV